MRRNGDLHALEPQTSNHPYDHNSDNGRRDADQAHAIARRLRGIHHGPLDRIRERREQEPLDRKREAEGDGEVGHVVKLLCGNGSARDGIVRRGSG